jgi:Rrf2 family protein
MKFNTKTRYGLRTVLELAMSPGSEAVFQKEISENQEISFKYLDHIISALKSAGIVQTASGRNSGYILTKAPEIINIYDIYKAFEPEFSQENCQEDAAREFWCGLNQVIKDYMENTSVSDLAERQKKLNQHRDQFMYYI